MDYTNYVLHPEDNLRFILIPSYISTVISQDGINWYIPSENGWGKTIHKVDDKQKKNKLTVSDYIQKYCSIFFTENKKAFVVVYNYLVTMS